MYPDGDVSKVAPFKVGDFDTGEEKTYNAPAREFKTFAISANDDLWPKVFVAQLVLAEADNGGINGFINALVDGVQSKVASILAAMAAAAAAGALGGMVGGVAGAIVGAAVGAAVAGIVAWLKIVWSDDIFDPRTSTVILPTPDARFGDDLESSTQTVDFNGHGGRYRLKYKWILGL
jgi:hypothetical protein